MAGTRFSDNVNIKNKQASFQYELLDKYVSGIALKENAVLPDAIELARLFPHAIDG